MQLNHSSVALLAAFVALAAPARAQAPGDTTPAPAPPAPDPNTAPRPAQPSDDAPTSDDYRDVLGGEAPAHVTDATTSTPSPSDDPVTGTGRLGVYHDTDRTTVLRALATIAKAWGHWSATGGVVVDSVTSASIDVRTSPALGAVDVMTSASGRTSTSGGEMSDTRYLATSGFGWKDSSGHAINATASAATERDYASISGGLNGSIDVDDRNVTLLGGFTLTDNWVSSVLDPTLHRKMFAVGWSAGVARVLTPADALRLRYDGKVSDGYQASPYRSVRFGDWTTTVASTGQIMFANTLGSASGLPESLPEERISHALTLEWVHALGLGIGVHSALRLGHDNWGIDSATPSLDLRIAKSGWRMLVGYRLYLQSRASFFASKYTADPSTYASYTSDKELGSQIGHLGSLDLATVLRDADSPGDSKLLLFLHTDVFRYAYPGFELLPSRLSAFVEAGLSWEL